MKKNQLNIYQNEKIIEPFAVNYFANDVLKWYKNECILINEFHYTKGVLKAKVIPRALNYGIIDMPYLTATQFTLALSQMAYVLTACLCMDSSIENLQSQDYKILLQNIPEGKCFISRQNWVFNKIVYKSSTSYATLSSERIMILRKQLMIKCNLNIGNGSTICESIFFMPLE